MYMYKRSFYLLRGIFILSFFIMTGYSLTEGSDWKNYVTDVDGCPYFYDADSVRIHEDRVKVWTKVSDEEYSSCNRTLRKSSPDEIKHRVHSQSLLYELSCPRHKFRLLDRIIYGSHGNVLHSGTSFDWTSIVPDSITDVLFNTLCK
jgi:hypothetical protein